MDPADKKAGAAIHSLIGNLHADLQHVNVLWEVAVLAASLGLAWWVARLVRARIAAEIAGPNAPGATLKIGIGGLNRVIFPLLTLVLVVLGRFGLRHFQSQLTLLDLAVPLLFSWMLVHLAIYLLRHAFAPSGPLRYWERGIAWTIWLGLALHITGVLPELQSFLDGFGLEVGKQRISALTILQGALSVAVTVVVALWAGRLVEGRLMSAQRVDLNLRVVLSKLAKTLLVVLAVLIALPAVGIDVTVLSVFGGALGVGIGFGLQKIAANYVSGFVILLDRSVSLGALVTIDGYYGEVRRLTARYMVVKGMDGTEAIIPNETVITSIVINHSYTDTRVRVELPVQVSYQSDVDAALRIMEDSAVAHPRVLHDPAPTAVLKGFGESGIDLELYVWISDPETGKGNFRSDIYRSIWKEFRSHGIEIPYPRRDIRILDSEKSSAQP